MKYDFRNSREIISTLIFSYILSAITGAVGLVIWFEMRRMIKLFILSSNLDWLAWSLADMVPFILFGIVWLIVVLYTQHYYEQASKEERVWKSFFWVSGLEAFVLFIAEAGIAINDLSTAQIIKTSICLVAGIILIFLGKKQKIEIQVIGQEIKQVS